MIWWQWMFVGALLLGAELLGLEAQFYLLFIGLSAVLVGLAEMAGFNMPVWAQWVAFGAMSLVLLVVFRRKVYAKLRGAAVGFDENLAGNTVRVADAMDPGAEARLEHRGSKWTARNIGVSAIAAGARAKVVKVDGLTLHIESE